MINKFSTKKELAFILVLKSITYFIILAVIISEILYRCSFPSLISRVNSSFKKLFMILNFNLSLPFYSEKSLSIPMSVVFILSVI